MNKGLIVGALLALSLVACKSTPMKEPAVEDKSPKTQTEAPKSTMDDSANTAGASNGNVDGQATNGALDPRKDPNNILSKRNVYFDFDKDEVKSEYRPLVEAHAKYLLANPSASLILQGNADDSGTREYNLSLGQRRAVAVKKVMNLLGVQDKQIETVSYGKEKANPNCGADQACKQQDRRVDVVYVGE